ncbi:hypothetical protein [Methylibium petroleiphilum]|nr:hypothetical protein [Methylibium petroleiphilum]
MEQAIHTALNWMGYSELKTLLEEFGFAVRPSESEDDLREAVRANLVDGTIPTSKIDTSRVPSGPRR